MENKYELLKDDTINVEGHILYRIKALRDFNYVKKGDFGGYIEKEENLSHENNCWVFDNARVYDNAMVSDNARVSGNAEVLGDAEVWGNAAIYGNAKVSGNTIVSGNAKVFDNAEVRNYAMVSGIVSDNAKVYGNAMIFDNAIVSDNAMVNGNAKVCGKARISKDAYITNTNDYILIGPIGSRDAITTFYLTKDKTIMVKCGCFNDTIDKFIDKVNETHKDNPIHLNNYIHGIDFAKLFLSR